MNGGAPVSMMRSTPCSASSEAKRSYSGIEARNSALLPALKFNISGTTPMPSGRMRISSSSVPGRRVGLTIPTTPRHNVKLMVDPRAITHYRQRAGGATTGAVAACAWSPCSD